MRGKLLFITGGLIGYVLGARAGRKRYEQIKSAAESFWNAEPVQRRVGDMRDFALDKVGDVPAALFDAGKKVVNSVIDKAGSGGAKGTGKATNRSTDAAAKSPSTTGASKSAGSTSAPAKPSEPKSSESKSTTASPKPAARRSTTAKPAAKSGSTSTDDADA